MLNNSVYQKLQSIIIKLDQQIDSSPANLEELTVTREQISRLLADSDSLPEPDAFIIDQFAGLVEEFEVEHPVVSEWLSKLSDVLSKMGL
ncbi:MAG: DUF4404 family protein [Kangiellaceae bacterium]|jgi:hypothetical protein|nr:DUF4404 family protein [Kangiellaceae bacterium]